MKRRRRKNPIDSKEEFIKKERLRQAILSLRILRGAAPGRTVTPWASFTAATAQRIMRAPGNKYRHFVDALRGHLAPTTNRKNPRRPKIRHADARWLSAYRDYIMQTRPKGWSFDRWYRVFRSLENLSDKGRIGRDFKIHRYPEGEADRLARAVRHARKKRMTNPLAEALAVAGPARRRTRYSRRSTRALGRAMRNPAPVRLKKRGSEGLWEDCHGAARIRIDPHGFGRFMIHGARSKYWRRLGTEPLIRRALKMKKRMTNPLVEWEEARLRAWARNLLTLARRSKGRRRQTALAKASGILGALEIATPMGARSKKYERSGTRAWSKAIGGYVRRKNPWPAFLNGIAGGAGFFAANKVLGAVGRVNGRRRKRRRR